MIGKISLKYFFLNRRKTYIAVIILSITVSIILSSNILINGYRTEIQRLSDLGSNVESEIDYIITPYGDTHLNFSLNQLERIYGITQETDEVVLYENYRQLDSVNFNNSLVTFEYRVVNFEKWNGSGRISVPSFTNISLISNIEFPILEHIQKNYNIFDSEYNISSFLQKGKIANINYIFIDRDSDFLVKQINSINYVEIDVKGGNNPNLVRDLESIQGVNIFFSRAYLIFLESSFEELISLVNLLQYVLSILLIFSITYIMFSLLEDSKRDIELFKMIGMKTFSIFLIFSLQCIIISLFAFILSIVLSFGAMNLIISLLHGILQFPFIPISLDINIIIRNFLYLLFIGSISGTIATTKVIFL